VGRDGCGKQTVVRVRGERRGRVLRQVAWPRLRHASTFFSLLSCPSLRRLSEAGEAFRTALKTNPESAVAAYNLGVIVAKQDIEEAIAWCRKARDLRPEEPKYGYTLAFYLQQKGDVDRAISMLEQLVRQQAAYPDAYALLGHIYEEQDKINEAIEVYKKAAENERLSERDRYGFTRKVQAFSTR